MSQSSPRATITVFIAMCALLATQTLLRYSCNALRSSRLYAAYLLVGLASMLTLIVFKEGSRILSTRSRQSWFIIGCGYCCVSLYWYFGRSSSYVHWFGRPPTIEGWVSLLPFFWFSAGSLVFRGLVPFVSAHALFGLTPADLGLRQSKNRAEPKPQTLWPAYLLAFIFVLPLLYISSRTKAFLRRYPFGRGVVSADRTIPLGRFALYQLAYFLVFVTGEAFWRGLLCFGLEVDWGAYAIPIMLVPYVVSHYGKPLAEAVGAIGAGSALGWLALKHRSVWLGILLHYAVALAMDLLSIWHNGYQFCLAT